MDERVLNGPAWAGGGIAIEPTESWERGGIKNFTSAAIPLGGGEWRLWYYAHPEDRKGSVLAVAEGKPGGPMRKSVLSRSSGNAKKNGADWSISNLPDGWQPVQPVYLPLGAGRHRLYFWVHAPGVVRYLCAESDDGRHFVVNDPYRAVLYHYHDRAVEANALPDGLSVWGGARQPKPDFERASDPDLVCNDATNVSILPDGCFELFSPALVQVPEDSPRNIREDNAAGFVRVIDRFTSRDGIDFGNRTRVLEPDESDSPGLQFYYLAVMPVGEKRLGLLGHYRADRQTLAIERTWSDDGIHWRRPEHKPWLDHSLAGEADSFGALAPHAIVKDDHQWWCFYTGFNFSHNYKHFHGTPRASVLFAKLPGDALEAAIA